MKKPYLRVPNQDSLFCYQSEVCGLEIYGVCDGYGTKGHEVANYVKENFVRLFLKEFKAFEEPEDKDIKNIISNVILKLENRINCRWLDEKTNAGGTTIVVSVFYNDKLYFANVGDSKAALISEVSFFQTNEHRPDFSHTEYSEILIPNSEADLLIDNGCLRFRQNFLLSCKYEDLFVNKFLNFDENRGYDIDWRYRSHDFLKEKNLLRKINKCINNNLFQNSGWYIEGENGWLALSRSLGDLIFKKVGLLATPEFYDPINISEFRETSSHLILASDGFWDFKEKLDLKNHLDIFFSENVDANLCAEELCMHAKNMGSSDDVTVLILCID